MVGARESAYWFNKFHYMQSALPVEKAEKTAPFEVR